ncbi:MAG TPA: hypothetical protein VFF91_03315 [Pseudoxanthomonas sp.]|nr:hypothetical protein [Pseudoxanthomonas sp.]
MWRICTTLWLWSLAFAAAADSWGPPQARTVESGQGARVARILPGEDGASAQATLLRRDPGNGRLRPLASYRLHHEPAPVDALLADDGTLVALDTWGRLGWGGVVHVYDARGRLRFIRDLPALLGPAVQTVPRSESSRWWRCGEPVLADGGATLRVATWDGGELRLDLHGGRARYRPGSGRCRP